jgi:hypothetical protein
MEKIVLYFCFINSEPMFERVYIKEVAKELKYEDYRAVYRWCKNNGIGILSDVGSRKKYILKAEYEAAKNHEPLKYIKEKYGENKLSEFLNATMIFSNKKILAEKVNYKPVGEYEKNFLNCLQNF